MLKLALLVQNYAITGGNVDLMNKHAQIEAAMAAIKI